MKKLLTSALLTLAIALPATADVTGVWATPPADNGVVLDVELAPCASFVCGTIVAVHGDGGDPSIVGRKMIWDMAKQSDGTYAKGKVWAPDSDRTFNGKMALKNANTLALSGCVLGYAGRQI